MDKLKGYSLVLIFGFLGIYAIFAFGGIFYHWDYLQVLAGYWSQPTRGAFITLFVLYALISAVFCLAPRESEKDDAL